MNKLLIPIFAGAMLPALSIQATAKTYGDFEPGQTFTLKVTDKESIRTENDDVDRDVPVPKDLPRFQIGDAITFSIGPKGALKGPGFTIRYREDEDRLNLYSNNPSGSASKGDTATIRKGSKGKPTKGTLVFYKYRFSGFKLITNSVTYKVD